MNEYRCISCDHIKLSESSATCPECGYKMFPVPYNRKEILIYEIQKFIKALMTEKIEDGYFSYYRDVLKRKAKNDFENNEYERIFKAKDDERFPNFYKIQSFVCAADKTEKFIERLNTSLDQIEKHICTSYQMEYQTDFECFVSVLSEREITLKKAMLSLGKTVEIEEINFPETRLDFSEVPNEELLVTAKELLETLRKLTEKIYKFIKQNNIYGTTYQKRITPKFNAEDNTDYLSVLLKNQKSVCKIIDKEYQIDVFSDGTKELQEMLRVLWNAVGVIMFSPILTKVYIYEYKGEKLFQNEFKETLIDEINERYSDFSHTVLSSYFFSEKDEDELFKLYNKMIEIDSFGFMGVNKSLLSLPGEHEEKLKGLIGLSSVKQTVQKLKAYVLSNKENPDLNLHMCFYGNPGTGKTEVARIIAGILYENKILPSKKVIEVDRSGLVSQYFGATAEKAKNIIADAMGGVLFIDEAYALGNNSEIGITDYGKEAIDTLVKAMEDYRGKFCVIFAGYKNPMLNMISLNPGLRSRIQFELDFPNYSRDELKAITERMLADKGYTLKETAMQRLLDITDFKRKEPNFANAREVRNILDGIIMCQNLRTMNSEDKELGMVDVNRYIEDLNINIPINLSNNSILTAEDALNNLIGLEYVKRMVKKIKAYAKKNKNETDFNIHMCFYGNPGTGKTEVARILSSLLYEAGVLSEAKLIETDAHGLIGKFVGETAPKTQEKISDAMGGVLFIDEAYGLLKGSDKTINNYGAEAIEVLLKNMEDRRGKFCAILAGYKNEMQEMISSNPGLDSRIQFKLEFPDYTREELGQIAVKFLQKKNYGIESNALELLLDITDYYRNGENFANARTIRNILDQVIMNQNLRVDDSEYDNTILKCDVEDYLVDECINLNDKPNNANRIGFI